MSRGAYVVKPQIASDAGDNAAIWDRRWKHWETEQESVVAAVYSYGCKLQQDEQAVLRIESELERRRLVR